MNFAALPLVSKCPRNFLLGFCFPPVFLVCVQTEEKPAGQAPAELTEEALNELLELCEEQFAQLEKVKRREKPDCFLTD